MSSIRRALIGLTLLLGSVACDLEGLAGSTRFEEEFHHSYALEAGGRLSVESLNGSVEIEGWDRPEVDISGRRYASSPELLAALEIDIVATDDAVRIRTVRPSGRRGNMGASFTIRAPRQIEIELVDTSNGSVQVANVEGNARLRTSNGSVRITGFVGDVEARSSNAAIELDDFSGSANLRTSNGRITAEAIRGYLEAETSNARITARVAEAASGRPLRLKTSNGSVNLTMEQVPTTDVLASTSNASITFRAPATLSARVRAETSSGSISNDFDVMIEGGTQRKNHLTGSIGGGGPLIDLHTSNASIRLEMLDGG